MKAFAITGLGETSFVDVADPVVGVGGHAADRSGAMEDAVALNTSSPRRILTNAAYAKAEVPERFWEELLT